jgi:hypothetical protein
LVVSEHNSNKQQAATMTKSKGSLLLTLQKVPIQQAQQSKKQELP